MFLLTFFLIIDKYFLIPAVFAKVFIPTAELIMLTAIQTNEANAKIETLLVSIEAKIRKCST